MKFSVDVSYSHREYRTETVTVNAASEDDITEEMVAAALARAGHTFGEDEELSIDDFFAEES